MSNDVEDIGCFGSRVLTRFSCFFVMSVLPPLAGEVEVDVDVDVAGNTEEVSAEGDDGEGDEDGDSDVLSSFDRFRLR